MINSMETKKRIQISRHGFTLIELLIVIVILSVLTVIVTGTFSSSMRRGRDTRRKNDLRAVANALESYYNDKGKYPLGASGKMMGCLTFDTSECSWGGQFKDAAGTLYMVFIPKDPLQTQTYYYYSLDGKSYVLYAHLENTLDEGNGVNQTGYSNPTGNKCGYSDIKTCTYGISSPDTEP